MLIESLTVLAQHIMNIKPNSKKDRLCVSVVFRNVYSAVSLFLLCL